MSPKTYTTGQAAEAVGITRATLQEWLRRRKFEAPKMTTVGSIRVRFWTETDLSRLRAAKARIYRKGGGRKKKRKA